MAKPPANLDTLTVFYDGACPLCSREMKRYFALDHRKLIQGVDISTPDFDAQAEELDPVMVNRWLHARDAAGKMFLGIDAFLEIWRRIPSTRWLAWIVALPGLYHLAWVFYRVFAANRYRLTFRCRDDRCKPKD